MGLSAAAAPRRIGVFGGAFDPPHDAHVALAAAAIEQLQLDRLHVVPTGDAWHKMRSLSPGVHRLAMCRLAFAGLPEVVVDERELRRNGPTYTIDTLRELQLEHPDAVLYLQIGADQAVSFHDWRQPEDILRMAALSIAVRAGPDGAASAFDAADPLPGLRVDGARISLLNLPAMPHSATEVRRRVAAGLSVNHLVPAAVAGYIAQHHLYQKSSMSEAAAKKDIQKLQRAIVDGLEDVKAQDIRVFNTEHLTPLFERVIIASGTSNRQTKALAASVRDKVREGGFAKPRTEGEDNGEWIIVDCGAAVAHIMQPPIRQYYNLEEIWGEKPVRLRGPAAKAAAKRAALARERDKNAPAAVAAAKPVAKKAATAKPAAKKEATTTRPAAAKKAAPTKPVAAKKVAAAKPAAVPAKKAAAKSPARKIGAAAPPRARAGRAATAVQTVVVDKPGARKSARPAGAAARPAARTGR